MIARARDHARDDAFTCVVAKALTEEVRIVADARVRFESVIAGVLSHAAYALALATPADRGVRSGAARRFFARAWTVLPAGSALSRVASRAPVAALAQRARALHRELFSALSTTATTADERARVTARAIALSTAARAYLEIGARSLRAHLRSNGDGTDGERAADYLCAALRADAPSSTHAYKSDGYELTDVWSQLWRALRPPLIS